MDKYLTIAEDFYSVQGEGPTTGVPSYFIRLRDCNLTCGASWGKVKDAQKNCVVVNSCCSILFPLLSKYAIDLNLGRSGQQIMQKKNAYMKDLIEYNYYLNTLLLYLCYQ